MKRKILISMLILGALSFGEKITSTGKSWDRIEKEYTLSEPESVISLMESMWMDYGGENYAFFISSAEFMGAEGERYLVAHYTKRPDNGFKYIDPEKDTVPKNDGFLVKVTYEESMKFPVAYYKIYKSDVKGVYYVNSYVDASGRKHPRLYFGFDEKLKKIVITDKDGNIRNILEDVLGI